MSQTKKFILGLMVALGALFVLDCASIILVFVVNLDTTSENLLAVGYLFLHLIVVAGAFYFATKAFIRGPSLLNVFMVDDHHEKIKSSIIVASILSGVFLVIGVYMFILLCGVNSFLNFFTPGLKYALMNVGFTVGIVSAFFAHYPLVDGK